MIGATCVNDDHNDDHNDDRNRRRSIMLMTRKNWKNWKAQGELSVSCQSANICKGHDQGQTAPYTSSTRITIGTMTSRIEPVSYYCFLLLLAMVWNVVVRFFVVVLVGCGNWSACYCSSDFCARPILTADFLWIFFVSCGVCIGSDFWRPRRVYCSAWVGVQATPGVPLTKQRGETQPQPWSDQPSQSWHTVTVL